MLILNVNSKKQAKKVKKLGAKLDPNTQKWYVENGMDYLKFAKWIDGNFIVKDSLYIIEAEIKCPKCNELTPVIGFGIENFYELYEGDFEDDEPTIEETDNWFLLIAEIYNLPNNLLGHLEVNYNYKVVNNKPSNYCKYCNYKQDGFHLFGNSNLNSPFFLFTVEDAEKLKLYKIKLPYDWAMNLKEGAWGNTNPWFKEYGEIKNLNLRII